MKISIGHSQTALYSQNDWLYERNKTRKGAQHATVCYHALVVYRIWRNVAIAVSNSCRHRGRFGKRQRSCSSLSLEWNSVDNINWKSYYLNNQLSCTLQRKPLSFVSPEHDPNSSELNPINDKIYGVIQQRDSESQVSWTPAKHWYRIWMKRLDFRVYMFCQVVQKHSLCELWR